MDAVPKLRLNKAECRFCEYVAYDASDAQALIALGVHVANTHHEGCLQAQEQFKNMNRPSRIVQFPKSKK
jgi:hypothetical protein